MSGARYPFWLALLLVAAYAGPALLARVFL